MTGVSAWDQGNPLSYLLAPQTGEYSGVLTTGFAKSFATLHRTLLADSHPDHFLGDCMGNRLHRVLESRFHMCSGHGGRIAYRILRPASHDEARSLLSLTVARNAPQISKLHICDSC